MQVLDYYPTDPGCCRLCGTSNVPTVDTGVFTDELGGRQCLYICSGCVGTAADTLGWVRPDKIEKATREVEKMRSVASMQGKRAAALDKVLQGFIEGGKFQVGAEFYDLLSGEDKELVLSRVAKKVAERVRNEDVARRADEQRDADNRS